VVVKSAIQLQVNVKKIQLLIVQEMVIVQLLKYVTSATVCVSVLLGHSVHKMAIVQMGECVLTVCVCVRMLAAKQQEDYSVAIICVLSVLVINTALDLIYQTHHQDVSAHAQIACARTIALPLSYLFFLFFLM
jgi:hypothetical protein